ncbi:MAG TPA: rhomboid family intramembrane serine protease [Solirubrobacteraceae bacterium]|nr:rhomboid family intramembrane serine protease [Solirubrobacteraceae bacterium]
MATCYRHPQRETGVACSSCGRPICPDCMTPTSVGMRCPECARDRTKVRTIRSGSVTVPSVTRILIAVNVLVFIAETATGSSLGGSGIGGPSSVFYKGMLYGPFIVGQHEYYRLLTAGFLHEGLIHILFNMWFLYVMGQMLEPVIGRLNFTAVYFASLLAGSFGALLFQPDVPTIGASGACFGVLGALIVIAYYRGISIWQSGLGLTLVINIVFSLSFAGISIGGHLGGVVGGALCGWAIVMLDERRRMPYLALGACALVAAVSVAAAIAVAGGHGLTPTGIGLGS